MRVKVQDEGVSVKNTSLDHVVRKVSKRLLWFLLVLYVIAHLDRINIGFAALSMNRDLLLTATAFGLATTVFNIAYFLCEIPSNLLLVRYGAKIWIPRIMVTWGIASAALMFTTGPGSLYLFRILVGIAEAGFVPGVLLYLTYWFPQAYRARATAMFMMAQPIAIAVGAPLSGVILDKTNGFFGVAGWRWLFLIEALPAVLFGIIAYSYLTNGPKQAKWLSSEEKAVLQSQIDSERRPNSAPGTRHVWRELLSRDVGLLALAYFGLVFTLNSITTWVPQIVREVSAGHSFSYTGVFNAIPALCAIIAMPFWSTHSDRKMERTWHIMTPMIVGAIGWVVVGMFTIPEVRLVGLIFCTVGAFTAMSLFWTVSATVLSVEARPAGIAFINSCGIIAAATAPLLIGAIRDMTNSFTVGLLFLAAMLIAAAGLIRLLASKTPLASVHV
jgi:MFS transporter, ACS family, 4-hydroxyphenylacetate permease